MTGAGKIRKNKQMADKLRKWKYYHCHMVSHIAQMAERFCLPTTINSRVNTDNWSLMLCSCKLQ